MPQLFPLLVFTQTKSAHWKLAFPLSHSALNPLQSFQHSHHNHPFFLACNCPLAFTLWHNSGLLGVSWTIELVWEPVQTIAHYPYAVWVLPCVCVCKYNGGNKMGSVYGQVYVPLLCTRSMTLTALALTLSLSLTSFLSRRSVIFHDTGPSIFRALFPYFFFPA